MADDFNRPNPPASTTPPVSGIDPYLGTPRTETQPTAEPRRVVPERSGGFGTGMLVAAVFVVVAILAAMFYNGRDVVAPGTTDGVGDGSGTTIDNSTPTGNGAVTTPPAATTGAPAAPGAPLAPTADPAAPAPADSPAAPLGQPAAPANP